MPIQPLRVEHAAFFFGERWHFYVPVVNSGRAAVKAASKDATGITRAKLFDTLFDFSRLSARQFRCRKEKVADLTCWSGGGDKKKATGVNFLQSKGHYYPTLHNYSISCTSYDTCDFLGKNGQVNNILNDALYHQLKKRNRLSVTLPCLIKYYSLLSRQFVGSQSKYRNHQGWHLSSQRDLTVGRQRTKTRNCKFASAENLKRVFCDGFIPL